MESSESGSPSMTSPWALKRWKRLICRFSHTTPRQSMSIIRLKTFHRPVTMMASRSMG